MRDLLPNGMLGVAIAGLLASFMAGMAANISAFNTVFSYDLWQSYVVKDKEDELLHLGRPGRDRRRHARGDRHGDLRGELREHHDLPPDAVRLLQRAALRHVHPRNVLEADDRDRRLDRAGGRHCRRHRVWVLSEDVLGVIGIGEQGGAFVAAGAAFVVDIIVSVAVSTVTAPKPESELVGLVYSRSAASEDRAEIAKLPWYQQPNRLAAIGLVLVIALNLMFL